jgi:hypothetical protein
MPYTIGMENTTNAIKQFISDHVEGDPYFKGYVVVELAILMKQNPTLSMSELLQDATILALEEWDRDTYLD